jgi:hypothetical protein
MEGKELHNDDEELNPKSSKDENEDSDNFGLPEVEGEDEKPEDLGEPFSESWEEKKEEETPYAYSDDFIAEENADSTYAYAEEPEAPEQPEVNDEYSASNYEEEYRQKKSPVGWIILAVVILIAIIIAVFWWMNRESEPKPVPQKVEQQPVIEDPEPEPEPEPIVNPEPVREAGLFEINGPTGRYHVIVASSIDRDLVMDYGKKLAKNGMTCNVLAPLGSKMFHRLSVADFASLNDAALKSEQLKSEFGEEVWVIRY